MTNIPSLIDIAIGEQSYSSGSPAYSIAIDLCFSENIDPFGFTMFAGVNIMNWQFKIAQAKANYILGKYA